LFWARLALIAKKILKPARSGNTLYTLILAVSAVPPFYWKFSEAQIFNMIPESFIDIYKAARAGGLKTAQEKQRMANAIIMFTLDCGFQLGIKAGMQWMGVDAGWCREPLGQFDKATEEKYHAEFRQLKKELGVCGIPFLDAL
jgi:dihydrodipicolinate synthase/N-acetylneuraminate lyase